MAAIVVVLLIEMKKKTNTEERENNVFLKEVNKMFPAKALIDDGNGTQVVKISEVSFPLDCITDEIIKQDIKL